MSATPKTGRSGGEMLGIGALIAVVIAVTFYFATGRERPLESSAMGHNAVVSWLKGDGIDVRGFAGLSVDPELLGLRILPILDTDLSRDFDPPDTREAYLKTGTEIDLDRSVARTKIERLKTLVTPPKWQRGARHSGYAHDSLLLSAEDASRAYESLGLIEHPMLRPGVKLLEADSGKIGRGAQVVLYAPQLFDPRLRKGCTPLVDTPDGPLMIHCKWGEFEVWALSDPDILNNHGLGLGDNAAFARAMVRNLAGDRPVLVDTTDFVFVQRAAPENRAREWSDLLRFFDWPFALLWIAAAALLALALWRGAIRFGPAARPFDDRIGASRDVSITAKARLMRLSGNDAALLSTHVQNRLGELAADLFGPHRTGTPLAQITRFLVRRTGQDRPPLIDAATAAMSAGPGTAPGTLMDLLDRFEREQQKVRDELGRPSGAR